MIGESSKVISVPRCYWCDRTGVLEERASLEGWSVACHSVCWDIWFDPAQMYLAIGVADIPAALNGPNEDLEGGQ